MNIKILDCTLRDGGYVNGWRFSDKTRNGILDGLTESGIDIIECGYLTKSKNNIFGTIFSDLNHFNGFIEDQDSLAAMIDVATIQMHDIPPYRGTGINKLRVVFYKHQIEEGKAIISDLIRKGYNVFAQPMVTVDYSIEEYLDLVHSIDSGVKGVSIVDSFGNMRLEQLFKTFDLLADVLSPEVCIGFHCHNNKASALHMALSLVSYSNRTDSRQTLIIDSSLNGMGRGAGNLQTETICDHLNETFNNERFNVSLLCQTAMQYITPFRDKYSWGYESFYFITAHLGFHPNYVRFIKEVDPLINPKDFVCFLNSLDQRYKTHCRIDLVRTLYLDFRENIPTA